MATNLVVKNENTVANLLNTEDTKSLIVKTLGKNRMQAFMGSVLTAMQDAKLQDVEPQSLINCFLKAATYNLPIDPNLGYVFPVPYKNKDKIKVAQFQMGTKGIVELALRTNQYKRLNVMDVREGEVTGYDFFGEVEIKWISDKRETLPIIGYMAAYELTNGMRKRVYWDNEKIKKHAMTYSKAHQYAVKTNDTSEDLWANNFGAMAEKTVLKDLLKYAPKSIELQNALKFDQSVITRNNGVETPIYVDNEDNDFIETQEYDIDAVIDSEEVKNETLIIPYSTYLKDKDKYKIADENSYDEKTKTIKVIKKQI